MSDKHNTIIEGITTEGQEFRPSDWAERISGQLATFKDHRMVYSPLLTPSMKNGHKCVIIDDTLKQTDPDLYEQLIDFAKDNHLVICDEVEE